MKQAPLGIYLHIPFCVRKCLYCDFLSAPADEQTKTEYVEALLAEIRAQAPLYSDYVVKTVFFGGGTPSLLPGKELFRIMECLRQNFSFAPEEEAPEITMEANPGTLTADNLEWYRRAGINRLSIGLQSANDRELKALGRIHTWEEFLNSFKLAREAGFSNINVDLMSALPGQTPQAWMDTLKKTAALEPEHISAYSLIIEEGTPFYTFYGGEKPAGGHPPLPDEETDRLMYSQTKAYLAEAGYGRYEISNYARPGFSCRHNLSYWKRTDYAGFGLGAASLRQNVRWNNTSDMKEYLSGSAAEGFATPVKQAVQTLSAEEQMEEFMFLGLRITEGISLRRFREAFGRTVEEVYAGPVEKLTHEGLLERYSQEKNGVHEEFLKLTDYGIDVSNYALSEFLF